VTTDLQDKLYTGIMDINGAVTKPGRIRMNWINSIQHDFRSIGMMMWEIAQQLAVDREGQHRCLMPSVSDT